MIAPDFRRRYAFEIVADDAVRHGRWSEWHESAVRSSVEHGVDIEKDLTRVVGLIMRDGETPDTTAIDRIRQVAASYQLDALAPATRRPAPDSGL